MAHPTRFSTTSIVLVVVLSVTIFFTSAIAGCPDRRVRGDKRLGDWRDLSKTRGWTVFNRKYQPFNPSVNLRYCRRRAINIKYSATINDYTKIINDAFTRLSRSKPPGGRVRLGPGTFPLGGQIAMGSYSCLTGAGMRRTTLKLKNNAKTFPKAGMIRSMWTVRVTIEKITIDGNMNGQRSRRISDLKKGKSQYGRYGVFTELTNYLYLRRVSVINHLGYGFDPHGSKREWAYYLLLENCEAKNNGLDGFTLDQTIYVSLRNSVGVGNHRHGVNIVTGTRYCAVVGNVMKNNGFKSGVGCNMMAQNNQCFGTRHIKFIRNLLVNGRKGGHCFNDVNNVSIQRSNISNSFLKSFCYYFDTTNKITIRSTTCRASRGGKGTVRALNGAKYRFSRSPTVGKTTSSTRRRS